MKERSPITAAYVRASKEKQELSIPVQVEKARRYVEGKCHIKPDCMPPMSKVYTDHGVSGRKIPFALRPCGKQILKELKRGDHLVILRFDRLGRVTLDMLKTIDEFETRGIVLHVVDFFGLELDGTTSPASRMMITMLASFAQYEGEMISQRTKEGLAELRRQGKRSSLYPPRGCKFVPGEGKTRRGQPAFKIVEDPVMIYWYKEMVLMWKRGMSFVKIAAHLNEKEVPPPPAAKSGKWEAHSVSRAVHIELKKEEAVGAKELLKQPWKSYDEYEAELELPDFDPDFGKEKRA